MTNLLSHVIDALGVGVVFFPLAVGVFLSFRMLRFLDLTVNGAFSLGAVVTTVLLKEGVETVSATMLGTMAGAGAGLVTGILISNLRVDKVLAGILVMVALYSVNVMLLGSVDYAWVEETTLYEYMAYGAEYIFGSSSAVYGLGIKFYTKNVLWLLIFGSAALLLLLGMRWFFRTRLGLAMRTAGENPSAARAVGANVSFMLLLTLMLSNALAAASGTVWAQMGYGTDLADGAGAITAGLAAVLLGDAFFHKRRFSVRLIGVLAGTLLYDLLRKVIEVLFGNLGNGLKLLTTAVVVLAIVLPRLKGKIWPASQTGDTA